MKSRKLDNDNKYVRLADDIDTTFPKLMVSDDGLVILFSTSCEGVVVGDDYEDVHVVGSYGTHWDIKCFRPYTGRIMLSN